MADRPDLTLDIDEVPFSTRGAWINLSRIIGLKRHSNDVHLVTHHTGMHPILRFIPEVGGGAKPVRLVMTPDVLSWISTNGRVDAVFDGPTALRVRGDGLGMRFVAAAELTPFTGSYLFRDPMDGATVLTSYESGRRYRLSVIGGNPTVVGEGLVGPGERRIVFDSTAPWELALEELGTAAPSYTAPTTFEELAGRQEAAFYSYANDLARGASESPAATKAAYVMWSATVAPSGFIRREAVLMSKHWMDKVWSWDHCFNAIALVGSDPDAALDQFLLPFDHQDASGALPDSVTQSEVLYNFVKPPIHGWAFAQLRKRSPRPFTRDELTAVYDRLAAWTRFWLDSRRAPEQPLPYYQHGNDSGWDNSTTFDSSRTIVSPDLAAFLILQLQELSVLAELLGASGLEWEIEADEIRTALYEQLWTGTGFIARDAFTGEAAPDTSLLNSLPIVLGESLRPDVSSIVAATIEAHLTGWGPATEPVTSAKYVSDGYWRGPIWAPSTFLVEDGLRRAGHVELADRVSTAFRRVCERSGFAENFDAVTGDGLRDRAYTWTASSYLTLTTDAAERAGALAHLTGER